MIVFSGASNLLYNFCIINRILGERFAIWRNEEISLPNEKNRSNNMLPYKIVKPLHQTFSVVYMH